MQRRNHFIPLFYFKNWDSFFISESTVTLLFLSVSFVLLQKSVRRSRKSRDERIYPESGTERWEKRSGRYDLFTLWHTKQLQNRENTEKQNWMENTTNRLPQRANLELFPVTRTMKYEMTGTFLDAAEKVKHLRFTQQFTLPTTFDCQTLSVEWKKSWHLNVHSNLLQTVQFK